MENSLMGWASAPGSCGELVQGTVDGMHFLISCPIEMYSQIGIQLDEQNPRSSGFPKIDRALKIYLKKLNIMHMGWKVTRTSCLPPGKGMASSTADIAAALGAAAGALNVKITPWEIARLALQVEPSDGVMFRGVYLFDYKRGTTCIKLGRMPRTNIILLDPGGTVDTLTFNRYPRLGYLNRVKEPVVREAMDLVCRGIQQQDIEMIGRGATASALANQMILPKKDLPEVVNWSRELGAAGVVIAHSGTVMGLIMPGERGRAEEAAEYIKKKKPHWKTTVTCTTGGGVKQGRKNSNVKCLSWR
ncbi:MAG: GHMP kinase [Desulfotomaculum sp.]|nr:GHMP kinase [Desulfotomaculum sp.]